MYEICSKLTIKTPVQRQRRSGVLIINFEQILLILLVFLLLTLNNKHQLSNLSIGILKTL